MVFVGEDTGTDAPEVKGHLVHVGHRRTSVKVTVFTFKNLSP